MKLDWVETMKQTGRLKLSFWEQIKNYLTLSILFIPLLTFLFCYFSFSNINKDIAMIVFIIIFALIGVFLTYLKYKDLNFKIIETSYTKEQIYNRLVNLPLEMDWEVEIDNPDLLVFIVPPKKFDRFEGDQITLILDNGKLMYNFNTCLKDVAGITNRLGNFKKYRNKIHERLGIFYN